ncbi:LysR family transcriptional regulator [Paraburkholderia megapolitana]|uniref:DNA-binding transcriptional regulator, LysR family n=1 Tax=Paraburkholderia megapolitana TaxID=420953 RepID=A0A1I3GQW2_9BURK|nr:LysR family transcriptional regulator [Paraburkholderia megapolitana]QDQ83016.1 LysR family transcriptional regulator [Paraburkholderia megapolitana]SFI25877.1 DNA-binding transcriptional regulator, LysR family [Paraburkholderia megapolitana]
MSLSLRSVRYFIAVAEAESITGATQSLNISQSVITDAIKSLETEVGTQLFVRHARGMVLTHAGHQFLRHAQQILVAVRNAEQAMSSRPDTVVGRLNIGVTTMMTGYFLPYLLDHYRRVFPQVQINVTEDQRSYIEHLLVNGELDVAVLIASNIENVQTIESESLIRAAWRLWMPANHALRRLESVSLRDIASEAMIMLKVDELEDNTTAYWRAAGLKPNVVMRTASVEAVRSLVATGAGLAILPDILYRPWSLDGDRLEVRDIAEDMPKIDIGIAWRRGLTQSETAQNFLVVAREYTRSHAKSPI